MNRNKLYQLFYDKLPASLGDILPVYEGCKIVTCLNPYYMVKMKPEDYHIYEELDYICSDGMGPIKLQKWFGHPKSVRLSFDMSSMAGPVFQNAIVHGKSLYVLGAKPGEVEKAVETIKHNFDGLQLASFHHGYIKGEEDKMVSEIIASGAGVVIIGMGAPAQDLMAIKLRDNGFVGTVYTCGGFIHQTQERILTYPQWIDRFGLRWLYRLFTQKGMVKRLIETYPKFVVTYSLFLIKKPKDKR